MLATKPVSDLRSPSLPEVRIRLDGMIPPSVNHYKKHKRRFGRSDLIFVTAEAKNFIAAVSFLSKGSVDAEAYRIEAHVYLGPKQKGDFDNFWKVIADSLVKSRIISSDAKVTQGYIEKHRDREHPRTEIYVTAAIEH